MCKVCGGPLVTGRIYCSQTCYHEDEARESLAAFWTRVEKTETCWLWRGQIRPLRGYGVTTVHHVKRYAHRIAWELTNGTIPKGLVVMHDCDNPPCVRPSHLRLGTKRDNTQDMLRKGRGRHQKVA